MIRYRRSPLTVNDAVSGSKGPLYGPGGGVGCKSADFSFFQRKKERGKKVVTCHEQRNFYFASFPECTVFFVLLG